MQVASRALSELTLLFKTPSLLVTVQLVCAVAILREPVYLPFSRNSMFRMMRKVSLHQRLKSIQVMKLFLFHKFDEAMAMKKHGFCACKDFHAFLNMLEVNGFSLETGSTFIRIKTLENEPELPSGSCDIVHSRFGVYGTSATT